MKLSVIAVTIGRLNSAARLFSSLARQTCKDFDVIFVHAPDISAEAARKLCGKFSGLTVTLLQSEDTCLSRSRNLALSSAAGDIIAFADDDCAYEPDTVAGVCAAFAAHAGVQVIMGRSVDMEDTDAVRPKAHPCAPLNKYGVFKDCPSFVHFYKAEVVRAVGKFDEELGVGCGTPFMSGEDTDYAIRALAAGFSVLRVPSVIVRHPNPNLRKPTLPAKVAGYAAGRMRLLRKHGFPCWFVLANVFYPLLRLPFDCLTACIPVVRCRWIMFISRLKWLQNVQGA
jgi:GT2 family glycosyltransferase